MLGLLKENDLYVVEHSEFPLDRWCYGRKQIEKCFNLSFAKYTLKMK